jgi:prevent-host-death family protein
LTNSIDQSWKGIDMREIPASDAKARFSELLDKVEHGETIVITRHGRVIARIVPDASVRQKQVNAAIAGIKALRKRAGKIPLKDLLASRHAGHKY